MAKVKVTNIDLVRADIKKQIIKASRSEEIRKGIGEIIANDTKKRDFGSPAEGTLKWRQKYDEFNRTDPSYRRNKINVTFTGETLEDLKNNVRLDSSNNKIQYEIKNSDKLHKKYRKEDGGTIGRKRAKFSDIQRGLIDKGYDYLSLKKETLDKLIKFIREEVAKNIK